MHCCCCIAVVELQALGQRCKHQRAVSLPLPPPEVIVFCLATYQGRAGLAFDKVQELMHIGSSTKRPQAV